MTTCYSRKMTQGSVRPHPTPPWIRSISALERILICLYGNVFMMGLAILMLSYWMALYFHYSFETLVVKCPTAVTGDFASVFNRTKKPKQNQH